MMVVVTLSKSFLDGMGGGLVPLPIQGIYHDNTSANK